MKKTVLIACALAFTLQLHAQSTPPPPAGAGPAGAGPAGAGPAGARPARAPRYIAPAPYDFDDHTGWTSLFDGKTLNGWEGDMSLWRVEDGAIVTSSTAAHPQGSAYLLLGGGDLKNFDFKVELKIEGQGSNSGVQFRAQLLGKTEKKNSEFETIGYQADWDYANVQTGALIECCSGPHRGPSPRPFKASMGQIVVDGVSDPDKPMLIGSFGDPEELKNSIHTGDWNQLELIARGNVMLYIINGKLMSVFIDDNPKRFLAQGRLELQLEGRGDIKGSFRDIWLKKLP